MQRRPSRHSILFAQSTPALKSTLVSYSVSPHPEPRFCTTMARLMYNALSGLSAIRDRFSQLHRCIRCLVQPFLRRIVKETKPVTKYPLEVASILVCRPRNLKVCQNSLGSTLVDRLPACVGLLMSPMSLPTSQSVLGS